MIKDFLYSEMSIEELYKEVIFFINSDEIQKGEFEGNQYILKKIDKENFILYAEYEDKKGVVKDMSGTAQFIHKEKLIEMIEKYIKMRNFRNIMLAERISLVNLLKIK